MATFKVSLQDIKQLMTDGLNGNGDALRQADNLLTQMINKDPDNWALVFYLAGLRLNTGMHGEAIALFHRANELYPGSSEVCNNIGTAYRREHINESAEKYLKMALELNSTDADILNNLGTLHINEGTPDTGEAYLRRAVESKPEHPHAHWNLGLVLLEQEKWKEGFDQYAWGLTTRDRMVKDYGKAVWWNGVKHKDKTLVIYGEQGIGDEIMFASMINDVVNGGYFKKVILDCHPRLEAMFKRAWPMCTVYPTRKVFHEELSWVKDEQPDYKVAIGTLGKFFRDSESDFPRESYLTAKRDLVKEYKEWLLPLGDGPLIGLSWVGGHKKTRKDLRAVDLDSLNPLFESNKDATFISLQYSDHGINDTKKLLEDKDINVWHFPEVLDSKRHERWELIHKGEVVNNYFTKEEAKGAMHSLPESTLKHYPGAAFDYDETAAYVTALYELGGVIVTVNTSLVHLCGALGLPCHVLTPSKPAWRYGMTREDMVWYPTDSIKQYRQIKDDWSQTITDLVTDVNQTLKDKKCRLKLVVNN